MDRDGWNQRYETTDLVWTATQPVPGRRSRGVGARNRARSRRWRGPQRGVLAQQGWQVTAVDFSDVGLTKADQLAATAGVEISTTCADLIGYRPPPRTFNLVAVLYVHLSATVRPTVNRCAADAVAPGGTLLVVGHDTTNPTDGYGGPQNSDVLFSPDDIVDDLAGSGLVVEKAERVPRPVTTEDGPRVAIDALVRAWRPDEP